MAGEWDVVEEIPADSGGQGLAGARPADEWAVADESPVEPGWGEAIAGHAKAGGLRIPAQIGGLRRSLSEDAAQDTINSDPIMREAAAGNVELTREEAAALPREPGMLLPSARTQQQALESKRQQAVESTIAELPEVKAGTEQFEEYQRRAQDARPKGVDPDSAKRYVGEATEAFIGSVLPTLTTAIVTRNPNIALPIMGTQVFGEKYGQAREEGRDMDQATMDALFSAAAETIPERIPLGMAIKPGSKALTRVLKTAGAEGLQEMFTEVLQIAYDKGVIGDDMDLKTALRQVVDAGIVGTIVGGGMGSAKVAADKVLGRDRQQDPGSDDQGAGEPLNAYDVIDEAPLEPGEVSGAQPDQAATTPSSGQDTAPTTAIDPDLLARGNDILNRGPATQEEQLAGVHKQAVDADYDRAQAERRQAEEQRRQRDYEAALAQRGEQEAELQTRISQTNEAPAQQPTAMGLAFQEAQRQRPAQQPTGGANEATDVSAGQPVPPQDQTKPAPRDAVATETQLQDEPRGVDQTLPVSPDEAPVTLPPGLNDARLKRDYHRGALKSMADELVEGGGMTLVPDENFVPGESDKPGDVPMKRTPSLNPGWFQSLAADEHVSVKQARNAVDKALAGQKLGVKQARVVGAMLDQVTGERTSPDVLADARQRRREAMLGLPPTEIYEDEQADQAGELFEEAFYPEEMTAGARAIYELAHEAKQYAPEDQIETILSSNAADGEVARQLFEVIANGRKRGLQQPTGEGSGPTQIPGGPQQGRQTETPPDPGQAAGQEETLTQTPSPEGVSASQDLFGAAPTQAQATADAKRKVDERLSGEQVPVGEGEGELFTSANKQVDIDEGAKLPANSAKISSSSVPRETSSETFETEPQKGGGILVKGDKDAIRAAVATAGIKAKGMFNSKKGGVVFPKKHADAVGRALSSGETGATAQTDNQETSQAETAQQSAKKPKTEPKPDQPQEKVDDFGEKLGGARKDMAQSLKKELSDDDIRSQPLSKIWPKSEVDAIEDNALAATMQTLRESIPQKPRKKYKLNSWVGQVKASRNMAYSLDQKFREGRIGADDLIKRIREHPVLQGIAGKVEILRALDRDQWGRIGEVTEYPDAKRLADGGGFVNSPFVAVEIDGRRRPISDVKTGSEAAATVKEYLGAKTEAKTGAASNAFEVRGSRGHYFINRKGDPEYTPLKTFTDSKEALEYKNAHPDELAQLWEQVKEQKNVKKGDVRRKENRPRTGKDHRGGKDATPAMFEKAFGFRGVEFGNWVKQGKNAKERHGLLNQSYDALMDLADLLGIPSQAISLNGSLGLGLGSRGKGGFAAAHYEPDAKVINLTKTKGAGTLAHEWFHALDAYFQEKRGQGDFITQNPETYYQHKKGGTKLPEWAFERMMNGETVKGYGRLRPGFKDRGQWEKIEGVRPEVSEAFAALVERLNESPMRQRSSRADKGKADGYWSKVIERAARAFENYVSVKMNKEGYFNDFLANVLPANEFVRDTARYPYLLEDEIAPIEQAFDHLFGTVQTEKTDQGVALYARRIHGDRLSPHDYVVPETPAFDGDGTGDLAYMPGKVDQAQMPIRLTVGVARDAHRGFGVEHMRAEADANPTREPPSVTGEREEDFARRVAEVADTFDEVYLDDNKHVLRSSKLKEALVVQERTDSLTGEDYYSVVTWMPAAKVPWGEPVWTGRGRGRSGSMRKTGGPEPSSDRQSPQSDRQSRRAQTSKFKFGPKKGKNQPKVTVKKRRRVVKPGDVKYLLTDDMAGDALTVEAARDALSEPVKSLKNRVKFHQSADEAGADAGMTIPNDALGFFVNGEVHLIAGAHDSPLALEGTFWHETTHAGVATLYQGRAKDYANAMTGLVMRNRNLSQAARKWRDKYGDEFVKAVMDKHGVSEDAARRQMRLRSIEEALADLSKEKGADLQLKGWDKFIAQIQAFMRKMGLDRLADWLEGATNVEALAMVGKTREAAFGEAHVTTGDAVPVYSQGRPEPTFYSKMRNVLDEKLPNAGKADALRLTINNLARKGEFKQEELEWSGLNEWLKGQEGKISKDQVIEFLEANQIQVQEVEKDDIPYANGAVPDKNKTKFDSYQLQGGKNYRELLLTLPIENPPVSLPDGWTVENATNSMGESVWNVRNASGEVRVGSAPSRQRAIELANGLTPMEAEKERGLYKSAHFDEPNIVAHVRFNERTDADGNRVLFLEEVQSDWHQEGRKKGYKYKRPTQDQAKAYFDIDDADWAKMDNEERQSYVDEIVDDGKHITGVPDAPFKTTWPMLAMKRMIRYAAENGFDSIAWTTGEQQAERFDLSKQISRVTYSKAKVIRAYDKSGQQVISKTLRDDTEVEDHIGKEAAERLFNSPVDEIKDAGIAGRGPSGYEISGEDLKAGGEGMAGFYDKILPSAVNKYVKKWGAKVGQSTFTEFDAHSVAITDKMKESVMQGQPLFSRRDDGPPRKSAFNLRETMRDRASRLADKFDDFRYEMQDKHIFLRRVQEAVGNVTEETDAYGKEELYHGRVRYQIDHLHDDYIKPLLELVAKSGKTLEDVESFLHARHAEEANAALREINEPDRQGYEALSGMTDEQARKIKSQYANDDTMQAIGKLADEIGDFQLTVLEQNGLESKEFVDAVRNKYQHYVPLHRAAQPFETAPAGPSKGTGYNTARKLLRRRAGSTKEVVDVLPNLIAQAETTLINAEKAKVHRALYQLAQKNPDPEFWQLDTPVKRYTTDKNGKVALRASPFDNDAPNALRVRIDGEDHVIRFNSENEHAMKMVAALRNMDQAQVGTLVRAGLKLNRFLSAINTGYNPEFIISNAVRDIQTAVYNLSSTEADGIAKRMVKDWPKAFAGIRSALRGEGEHEWATHFAEFREAGAMTGWLEHSQTIEDFRTKLNREVKTLGNSRKAKTKRGIRKMMHLVEDYNMVVENAVRLSAFVNARQTGLSKQVAARMAKNLTVNFNRRGNKGVIMNGLYLFYNASIQGSTRLLTTLATSKKGRRLVVATMGFAVMMDLLNRSMGGDDDDDVPYYDKIGAHEKERNLIFMDPFSDEGDYYKFPLPWGYNVFHVMGQKAGQGLYSAAYPDSPTAKRTGMNDISDIIVSIANAFNPIGGGTVMQTLSPTIMDPLAQHAENKNWMGNDLMPVDLYGQETPQSQKAWRSTPQLYKDIAEGLNALTGGNAARSGAVDISPETLNLAYDTATGGLGRFVTGTVDTLQKAVDDDLEMEVRDAPLVRKVTGSQRRYTDQSLFYDRSAEIDTFRDEMDLFRGKPAYQELMQERGELRKLFGIKKVTDNRLKFLRKRYLRALEDDDQKAVEEIQKQMWDAYKQFNQRYDRVVD